MLRATGDDVDAGSVVRVPGALLALPLEDHRQSRRSSRLALVAGLAVAGIALGSVSLLATVGDCIPDAFAVTPGLLAVHLRDRHDKAGRPPHAARRLLLSQPLLPLDHARVTREVETMVAAADLSSAAPR